MRIDEHHPAPRLGKNGLLVDTPENQDLIRRIRAAPRLTAAQLFRLSRVYRHNPALLSLADHLYRNAVLMVAATKVPATQDDPPDNAPVDICEFKCTWWTVFDIGTGLLWENCGEGWHVIGPCLES